MTLRSAPDAATWFLRQFGSHPENESVIGDLIEQYQRGRGSLWYWRQVLMIVFTELRREFRGNKRGFIGGFVKTWWVWGCLQATGGVVLLARYVWLHPEQLQNGISVDGFPLLTLRAMATSSYAEQVEIFLLTMFLNVLTLLLVGRYCASSTRIHPRTMLLAFITSYIVWDAGWMATNLLMIARHLPTEVGLTLIIRDLIALPLTAALILIGGMRLSPVSPQFKR